MAFGQYYSPKLELSTTRFYTFQPMKSTLGVPRKPPIKLGFKMMCAARFLGNLLFSAKVNTPISSSSKQ
jgi:hypothetical protein